jgi:dual specificity phosphatase 12
VKERSLFWYSVLGKMKLVREHLYIGNINDANAVIKAIDLKAGHIPDCNNHVVEDIYLQITHMLSLLSNFVLNQENPQAGDPYALVSNADPQSLNAIEFVRKTVALRDMECENLLGCLEECLDFIEEGRKNGHILVHCVAGVSRRSVLPSLSCLMSFLTPRVVGFMKGQWNCL